MSKSLLLRLIVSPAIQSRWRAFQSSFPIQVISGRWFHYFGVHQHTSSVCLQHCLRGYCSTTASLSFHQDAKDLSKKRLDVIGGDKRADESSKLKPDRAGGVKYNCSGCGAVLQSTYPKQRGYIIQEKLDEWLELANDPQKVLARRELLTMTEESSSEDSSRAESKEGGEMSVLDEECEEDRELSMLDEGCEEGGRLSILEEESEEGGELSMLDEGCEEGGKLSMLEEESEEGDDCDTDTEDFFPEELNISEDGSIDNGVVSSFICSRCFSLKNYNNALNITLDSDDYLRHLSSLKEKRALIILMLDVTDFPCCVFPNLKSLLSPDSSILIVVNKIDLFPRNLKERFWSRLRTYVISECQASFGQRQVVGVRFISVMRGIGTTELSQEIVRKWGTKGDIYLMGCTNVGKSSLFNKLLLHLCGSRPGELNEDSNLLAPKATISQWPGTTLGLLSFPLMSVGKRRRLLEQQRKREWELAVGANNVENEEYCEDDEFQDSVQRHSDDYDSLEKRLLANSHLSQVEVEGVIEDLGLRKKRKTIVAVNESPQNKYWLHDTPGAINEAQLINYLTPKELLLGLPKVPLRPWTFILKPGQCLFLGGLARLDYVQGSVSAYFTVFAWSYLHLHTTKIENADILYKRHLDNPESLFKIPIGGEERTVPFPPLEPQDLTVHGTGWIHSAADVVLSSAGWVAVTAGGKDQLHLRAHTPKGKGIHLRRPALFADAVNVRGKREKYGNRTAFLGNMKKWRRDWKREEKAEALLL